MRSYRASTGFYSGFSKAGVSYLRVMMIQVLVFRVYVVIVVRVRFWYPQAHGASCLVHVAAINSGQQVDHPQAHKPGTLNSKPERPQQP